MNKTIEYYNKNANEFFDNTVNIDMSYIQDKFLSYLAPGSLILDAGCGSGRDTKYFIEKGFKVTSMDASKKMVELSSNLTGQETIHRGFIDIDEQNAYDAIWCCASLLHVPSYELPIVLSKLESSLRTGGIIYLSFMHGIATWEKDGRRFVDMNEDTLDYNISIHCENLHIHEYWFSKDSRPDRDKSWFNVIIKKWN